MGTEKHNEPLLNFQQKKSFALVILALFMYVGGFQAFNVVVSGVLTKESSAVGASYSTITTIAAFGGYLMGFVTTGSTTIVGKHHAKGDHIEAGKAIESSIAVSLIAGTIASIFLAIFRHEIVSTFDPSGELLPETTDVVLWVAIFFWIGTVGTAVTGIYFGLGMLIPLAAFSVLSGAFYAGLFVGLYQAGYGLISFAVGTATSKTTFALGGVAWLYFSNERRTKFNLHGVSRLPSISRELFAAFSFVGVRSLFSNVRFLLMVIFTVRMGTVEGATYLLLDKLTGITYALTRGLGFIVSLVGARLYGRGQIKSQLDPTIVAPMRSLWALGVMCSTIAIVWGLLVGTFYATQGRQVVFRTVNETELDEFEQVFTPATFYCFVANQPFHAISSLYELYLISAHDYAFVGLSIALFFCIAYAPMLFYGYYQANTFEFVYSAETLFMGLRALACMFRWHLVLAPRYSPPSASCATRLCSFLSLPWEFRMLVVDIRDSFAANDGVLVDNFKSFGETESDPESNNNGIVVESGSRENDDDVA